VFRGIKTQRVLGAETGGLGIPKAGMAAANDTRLYDISQTQLNMAVGQVMSILKKGVDLGKLSQDDCNTTFDRLKATTSIAEAVVRADVIIEAAPEKVDLKIALLSAIEASAPAEAIIASNTSALSITELAAVLKKADSDIDEEVVDRRKLAGTPVARLLEQGRDLTLLDFIGIDDAEAGLRSWGCSVFHFVISVGYASDSNYANCMQK